MCGGGVVAHGGRGWKWDLRVRLDFNALERVGGEAKEKPGIGPDV